MQSIDSYDFKGKRAIIRVDFNVPLNEKNSKLPTIPASVRRSPSRRCWPKAVPPF